jgi:hypothetical protein
MSSNSSKAIGPTDYLGDCDCRQPPPYDRDAVHHLRQLALAHHAAAPSVRTKPLLTTDDHRGATRASACRRGDTQFRLCGEDVVTRGTQR